MTKTNTLIRITIHKFLFFIFSILSPIELLKHFLEFFFYLSFLLRKLYFSKLNPNHIIFYKSFLQITTNKLKKLKHDQALHMVMF